MAGPAACPARQRLTRGNRQVGTLKKGLLRPRLSAIITLSRLPASHPDRRAVLIQIVALQIGPWRSIGAASTSRSALWGLNPLQEVAFARAGAVTHPKDWQCIAFGKNGATAESVDALII
jgi:hypothetical protein